jgi:hypothetical protein
MKDLGKKKLLIIAGGLVGLVILIVIILLIYNAIFGKTSYKDIENKVLAAAKEYYSEHTELLPQNENEEVTTTDSALTAAGKLKSMSELTKKMNGVTCTATVVVTYANGEYRYTPLLDCGSNYSTKTLTSYIEENETRVYSGQGLYDLNGELVFRGEDPNNYVKFSGKVWRIVKIENDHVVMILNEKMDRTVWDDRFNTERNRSDGINDYEVSRIYENLTTLYQDDTIFNKSTRNLLAIHSLYTGKRYESDSYNDGSIEKSTVVEGKYIGLLPLYDYINASIDTNCTSSTTESCTNYNYLNHFDYNWWTLTADASNTYKVYRVDSEGIVESLKANSNGYLRPVIYLAKDALYVSGDGTESNPYTVK